MASFTFETTPKIICEQGGADRLGEIARGLYISRLFLVTDAGLVRAGLIEGALASLAKAQVAVTVFSDVLADPPELSVQAAVDAARAAGADGVFLEVHDNPAEALSDGGNCLALDELEALLARLIRIKAAL